MTDTSDAAEMTRQGIGLLRAGDTQQAARILYQALQLAPRNQIAWFWLSGCFPDGERQRKCLENAITINPDSQIGKVAALRLERLRLSMSISPALPSSEARSNSLPGVTMAALPVPRPTPASDSTGVPAVPRFISAHQWLDERNIIIKNHHQSTERDTLIDKLAVFLGEHYHSLSGLCERIRRALSSRDPHAITLNLSDSLPSEIGTVTSFCKLLYEEYAFLASYVYIKKTKTVRLELLRSRGDIHLFFTGNWLERYVCVKIKQLLEKRNLHYTHLVNTEVILPKGHDFELDLLFLVEGQPLWIECKTGDIQRFIARYGSIRSELGIPKQRAFLVGLDITDEVTYNLTLLHHLTIVNQENFLERVSSALRLPSSVASDTEEQAVGSRLSSGRGRGDITTNRQSAIPESGAQAMPPRTFTLLKNAHLRPLPEYRRRFIKNLIEVMQELQQPVPLKEIRERVRSKYNIDHSEHISSTQAQDMFEAVLRGGFVLTAEGQMIRHFVPGVPAIRLTSTDAAEIERGCVESYVLALLMIDLAYFTSVANAHEFEHVVGACVPAKATIERLKQQVLTNAV